MRIPIRWHLFTDGAWIEPKEGDKGPPLPAGYGVCELESDFEKQTSDQKEVCARLPLAQLTNKGTDRGAGVGKLTWVVAGQVETDASLDGHIGATVHTNNSGELTAMYYALHRSMERKTGEGGEAIYSDSLYAINMTKGKWKPKTSRNKELVQELREMWRVLQRKRPGEVILRHVRSHVENPGNELADWLADRGISGGGAGETILRAAAQWVTRWMERHKEAVGRTPAAAGGSTGGGGGARRTPNHGVGARGHARHNSTSSNISLACPRGEG